VDVLHFVFTVSMCGLHVSCLSSILCVLTLRHICMALVFPGRFWSILPLTILPLYRVLFAYYLGPRHLVILCIQYPQSSIYPSIPTVRVCISSSSKRWLSMVWFLLGPGHSLCGSLVLSAISLIAIRKSVPLSTAPWTTPLSIVIFWTSCGQWCSILCIVLHKV
jgi:hypothetical protein